MKVFVACHKKFDVEMEKVYSPIMVGAALNPKIPAMDFYDDTGVNISSKNKEYCELTAAYWVWKNCQDDVVGLVHYRRYFAGFSTDSKGFPGILRESELIGLMASVDLVLPKPCSFVEGDVESNYRREHHGKDLDAVRLVLSQHFPEYLASFEKVMGASGGSFCNMFIGKKSVMDDYFEWLFAVLFELEKRVDMSTYDDYQRRLYGFMAERLFNVWVEKNQPPRVYWPLAQVENEKLSHLKLNRRLKLFFRYWRIKLLGAP